MSRPIQAGDPVDASLTVVEVSDGDEGIADAELFVIADVDDQNDVHLGVGRRERDPEAYLSMQLAADGAAQLAAELAGQPSGTLIPAIGASEGNGTGHVQVATDPYGEGAVVSLIFDDGTRIGVLVLAGDDLDFLVECLHLGIAHLAQHTA